MKSVTIIHCIAFRVQSNYEEGTLEDAVLKDHLYAEYINDCKLRGEEPLQQNPTSKITFKIFPNIKAGRKYVEGIRQYIYKGLRRQQVAINQDHDYSTISFDLICQMAPPDYFCMKKDSQEISFGMMCGVLVNGYEIMKKIIFTSGVDWKLFIGKTQINLNLLGLEGTVAYNKTNILIIFKTVKKARICMGKPVGNRINKVSTDRVDNWSTVNDENSDILRVTNSHCYGVVPFSSNVDFCRPCQKTLLEPTREDKTEQIVREDGNSSLTELIDNMSPDETNDVIRKLFPNSKDDMILFLQAQKMCCDRGLKHARGRRWDKLIIQKLLSVWIRSPKAYEQLQSSGLFMLPSVNLLQRYKNCFQQKPGIHHESLAWMHAEAIKQKSDMCGGLLLDEMHIQEDITLEMRGSAININGLVDMGATAAAMHKLNNHNQDIILATHVLQFMFLSFDGFRFPFAWFATHTVNAPDLHILFWQAINKLVQWGFQIDFVSMDGANANRVFVNMQFSKNPAYDMYTIPNMFRPSQSISFIMDYSHVLKRIRNNVYASGVGPGCSKLLQIGEHVIAWDHWVQAYNWDRAINPIRVHQKLTHEHLFLNNAAKMRNHLAEEVLDVDMLNLMEQYQKTLIKGDHIQGAIDLLTHTSLLVKNFRDFRPISDMKDKRMAENQQVLEWFHSWQDTVLSKGKTAGEKQKMWISWETADDIKSLIIGFEQVCCRRISAGRSVSPAGINSDVIENMFCQQRAQHHGANTNPTIAQYKYGVTSTILGQNIVSKKSNASAAKGAAQPYCFSVPAPLQVKIKKIKLLR